MSAENLKLYDELNMGILALDSSGSIVYFNSAFLTLFKLSPRHVNKSPAVKDLLPNLYLSFKQEFDSAFTQSGTVIGKEMSISENEQLLTLIPRFCKVSDVVIVSFNDMSVEKKLYEKYREKLEELKSSHEQIMQADKLKTIGEMSANISHEINNPLTVASGNAEIIEFTLDEEDLNTQKAGIKEAVDNIKEAHERISHIITGMKEFLHKKEDRKEYATVKEIVDRSVHLVKNHFEDNKVGLKIDVADPSLLVLVNKIKLEQVIINLLQNALDALVESETKDPNVTLKVSASKEEAEVFFDVTDNGPGVSTENREKIFQAFFTTKDVGKGTGLGLSISSRIIQAHQGKLECLESSKGAHFRIELPSIEVSSFVDNTSHFLNHDNQNVKRVLIVDNEPTILNLCQKFCEDEDLLLIGSTSGDAALKMIAQTRVDVVVTDVNMPGMTGPELAKAIKATGKHCPVIYMSGDGVVEQYKKDKENFDIKGAIVKPFTKESFMTTILGVFKQT